MYFSQRVFKWIVIAPMLMAINVDKKPMLSLLKSAVDVMFNNPQHMFYTGRVMDILYDGIPIDCSSEEFSAQAVCSAFASGEVKAARPHNATHYALSFFQAGFYTNIQIVFALKYYLCIA